MRIYLIRRLGRVDVALVVEVVAQSWLVAQSLDLLCAKVSLGTTLNLKSLPVAGHLPQQIPWHCCV